MEGDLIFHCDKNRNLFKTENLIGCLDKSNFDEIFTNKILVKLLENDSINSSVNAFIQGNLNLSMASHKSFVHRNTLIYRITKIRRLIGLDLREFEDCVIYLNVKLVYDKFYKKNA